MNEPEDQGFYSSNFPDFLNSLNSVDVVRGVGTTSYGMASYAGAVNFESVNLRTNPYQSFTGTYGSFNTHKISSEINTGELKNNLAFYSRATVTGSDGYRDHSGNKGYSYFFSGGYFGKKHIIKTNAFVGSVTNEMAWIGASQKEIDSLGKTYNPNSANELDNFNQSFIQIQDYYHITSKSSIVSSVFYNRLKGNWDIDLKNTFGVPDGPNLNYQLLGNFIGAFINYKYSDGSFRFNTGLNGNYYERTHACADKSETSTLFYENKGIKNSGSVFAKLEYDLKKLTIFGDIQYRIANFNYIADTIDPTSAKLDPIVWNMTSPKVGLSYSHSDKIRSYISVGYTQREPTRSDLFGAQDNLFYVSTDTTNFVNVKPESVTDVECGIKMSGKKISGNLNLFFMNFKNEITLKGAVGVNSLPLMTNVDRSFRSGVELDLKLVLKRFTLTNSSSYIKCQINSDNRKFEPVLTPKFIINQGVEFKSKYFSIGANGHYISERYMDLENLNTIEPQFDVDMNITLKHKKNDIMFGIYNVFNSNGINGGYLDGVTPRYFVDAPRHIYVTVHINF